MTPQNKEITQTTRYTILILCSISAFAGYYIMDIPALLQSEILDHFSSIYDKETDSIYFSLLYSFYNIPNILLPLIGGSLSDQLGYRSMIIVFILFMTLGQFLTTVGFNNSSFPTMIFGRFIYGVGGESLGISLNTLIIKWFKGTEISFAFAINLSIIRMGSIFNSLFTPRIAEFLGLSMAFYFGFCICLLSLFVSCILIMLDMRYMKNEEEHHQIEEDSSLTKFFVKTIRNIFKQIRESLTQLDKIFWTFTVLMIVCYVCVLTFNSFSQSIIIDIWFKKLYPSNSIEKNQELAGDLMSIPFITSTILSPIFGLLIDKYGFRVKILLISTIVIFISFIFLPVYYPTLSYTMLGLSYSMFGSVIWPSVTYIVPPKYIGISYGLMNSLQNFGMGIFPIFIAFIEIEYSSYAVIYTFVFLAVVAIILVLIVNYQNSSREVSLDDSNQKALMDYIEKTELDQNNYAKLDTKEPEQVIDTLTPTQNEINDKFI